MTDSRRQLHSLAIYHLPLVILLLAYLVLAVAYSLASPLYEPTDEIRHFRYVRHLAVTHSLPVQRADAPRAQSHHPPLYYALGALVSGWVPVNEDVYYEPPTNPYWAYRYWEVSNDNKNQYLHGDDERFPFHGVALAVYLVRWMTVLIGAGAVWLTYCIGREVFPDQPALAVGGAALVAFNPQFLYLSGAVNNDIPATLCGAAVLLACVRLVRKGPSPRADVTLGILYGLALLTKFHLVALLGIIELAYLLAVWRARDWRAFLRANLVVLGLSALISGWWFARNWILYGDPTGMAMVNELWAGRTVTEGSWAIPQSLPYLWSSLWGRFGYGQVPLPRAVYQALFAFCVLALGGYLIPGIVRRLTVNFFTAKAQSAGSSKSFTLRSLRLGGSVRCSALWKVWLLLAMPVIFTLVVFYYISIQPAGPMGRFLFPALPAFAVVLIGGLSRFLPPSKSQECGLESAQAKARAPLAGQALSVTVTIGMAALAVYALVGVLYPAFARPRPLTETQLAAVPNPTNVEFGGVVRLLGYRVEPQTVEPGATLNVTLYWQALARTERDHAVFVHLISDVGTMIAQRDTYPGLGNYPTTVWEPGTAFADIYRVHVPETAYTPDSGFIQVGVYLPDGPRLTTPDGRDALRLATVAVRPRPGEYPNPLNVNFGNRIALAGYTLDRRVVRPGETIRLTLYWKTLAPMRNNYSVFVHVLGVENQVWAMSDNWPVEGRSPTSLWPPGQVVEDVRELTVGLTTPPSLYDVEVGLYALDEGRLPVVAEDGHWLADRVLLSKVRVEE